MDGRRVLLEGTYQPVRVRQGRPAHLSATSGETPCTVQVVLSSRLGVMLERYYAAAGCRGPEERERFAGRRVRVIGVLHAFTPSQRVGSGEAETMIGPYLDVERIEAADRRVNPSPLWR